MVRLLVATVIVFPLLAGGCGTPRPTAIPVDTSSPAPEPPPELGKPFALARGESTVIDGLGLTFAAVLEDSRCPLDVTCVWEGRASINVAVTHGGRAGGVNLEIPGGVGVEDSGRHRSVTALGHRITLLALDPYPGTPDAEPGAAPRATLIVAVERGN